MFWVHKQVEENAVPSISLLFREQAASFDPEGRMLLVSVAEAKSRVGLWLCLPELDLQTPYLGFTLCTRADLPYAPSLVAGCPDHFARVFQHR